MPLYVHFQACEATYVVVTYTLRARALWCLRKLVHWILDMSKVVKYSEAWKLYFISNTSKINNDIRNPQNYGNRTQLK